MTQGNTVEKGIFEKKRLVNSVRYVSQDSVNFGNIARYIRGQYSLMKTRAARSENRIVCSVIRNQNNNYEKFGIKKVCRKMCFVMYLLCGIFELVKIVLLEPC